MLSWIL